MPRAPFSSGSIGYTFGPGGITPVIKLIIVANVVAFLVTALFPRVTIFFGLSPQAVFGHFWLWQPVTYMFLHSGLFHLLFNMLALWMFGTELERLWGTAFFTRYYFITGVGAAATTLAVSLLPFDFARPTYYALTIGASGSVYGILLAYGLYYPDRPIYMYFLFPIPAKYFVLLIGAIAFYSSLSAASGGVAHAAHLGGLVVGYLYLSRGRGGPIAEIKYRYMKWKMARARRRFDVLAGGRRSGGSGWNGSDRIH